VVVQAVADLFLGDARLVAAARDVVDHAVAVVVQAVADLRLRLDGPHAGAPGVGGGGRAQPCARLAAQAAHGRAPARRAVAADRAGRVAGARQAVDHAIAVVVLAVAGLGHGRRAAHARGHAVRAREDARRARPHRRAARRRAPARRQVARDGAAL